MATFVDDDAYLAAGGTIERDLFSNESNEGSWYSDPAVLRDTVMAQLETLATPLRSDWKWVDCIVELQWSDTAQLGNIRAIPADPTPDEALQLSKYETDIKTLEDADPETFSDDDFDQLNALQTALKHLSATIEARATYADDHRVYAGCIVSIDADGDLQVFKGLVRPNDAPAPAAPTTALAPNTAPASDPALTPASGPRRLPAPSHHPHHADRRPRRYRAQERQRRRLPLRRPALHPQHPRPAPARDQLQRRVRPRRLPRGPPTSSDPATTPAPST